VADDYVRRTAITRLSVDGEQRELLEETISEWKRGCQLATDMAWGKCNAKSDVQPLAYDDVREQTDLGSQHAILATHQAAQAITGCIERRSNGKKVSKPTFTAPTVKYDTRTMTLFDDDTVSLSLPRRVASGVRSLFPMPTMATNDSTSTPSSGALRKVRSPPATATTSYTSVSADTKPMPNGAPPRTERSLGLTSVSKTSPSPAQPTSLAGES
jgi:hypothetical protein